MHVVVAEKAGYCFGIENAMRMVRWIPSAPMTWAACQTRTWRKPRVACLV